MNIEGINKYCKEDISLIENYDKAISDTSEIWDCHHRLETELNVSAKQLIKMNLYYDRPASELIFLTHAEHTKLHNLNLTEERRSNLSKSIKGRIAPNKGVSPTKKTKKKMSESRKGKKIMTDGIERIWVAPEYWGEFLDIGYWFACQKKHFNVLY